MTDVERELTAHFLDRLYDRLGRANCNDFDLKAFVPSLADRNTIVAEWSVIDRGGPSEDFPIWSAEIDALHDCDYRLPDFCVVGWLRDKLAGAKPLDNR